MKLRIVIWPLVICSIAAIIHLNPAPAVREILTSQQLFVVKLTPVIRHSKSTKQKFEAKLQHAFKVIKYESDSSYVELLLDAMSQRELS